FLSVADVQRVIAQAVAEAKAQGVTATIAVVDRVGNVLAVFRMDSALGESVLISSTAGGNGGAPIDGGLDGVQFPIPLAQVAIDDQAAIAKAVTGAYLSSEGNAFSTRVASQIVQENFNPGERDQPSGPLFGVQFSSLACSDLVTRFNGVGPDFGPKRSPLGLSADPGGFPLYKAGVPVGGVGVISDGVYGLDKNLLDSDRDQDEMIAYAATFSYAAPRDRRADQITVDGKTLRFSDIEFSQLTRDPATAPAFSTLTPADGQLLAVFGYTDGVIRAGTAFGQPASGIRPDSGTDFPNLDAYVLVDGANVPRFPPRAGTDAALVGPATLTAVEVRTVLGAALAVANRARAQIRRPLGTPARVTISIVDSAGEILGVVRGRDAPIFGIDVSLQKARTAAFFSSSAAASFLRGLPDAIYLDPVDPLGQPPRATVAFGDYVDAAQAFLQDPNALETGEIAFSDRAGGNLSRPFYPDGLGGRPPGPFSKPAGQWSVFSTGLQLDLSINAVLRHVVSTATAGTVVGDVGLQCPGVDGAFNATQTSRVLANGMQIFPGSVPIYRGDVLVGGIGVSGDGVDQDDMISFLGLHEGGQALAGAVGNAPPARRADTLTPQGVRLRYVQCPQAPYFGSSADNVCAGK
ncbi:heme-binding protein, partial [Thiocapsa sp.]|uniref:heme-binding protein n=1 Tax=Thiocapsa sp. TaxID=2024551 RepID=UPI003593B915